MNKDNLLKMNVKMNLINRSVLGGKTVIADVRTEEINERT